MFKGKSRWADHVSWTWATCSLSGIPLYRLDIDVLYSFIDLNDTVLQIFNLRSLRQRDGSTLGVRRYVELMEQLLVGLLAVHYKIRNVGTTKDTGINYNNFR